MERFPEHLRAHFESTANAGEPAGGADLRGEARNAACGDHVVMYLRWARTADSAASAQAAAVSTAAVSTTARSTTARSATAKSTTARSTTATGKPRTIAAAGFKAQGCPAAMATASAACSLLTGLVADSSLPAECTRLFEARFGRPKAAHRHALGLVTEALAAAVATPDGSGAAHD